MLLYGGDVNSTKPIWKTLSTGGQDQPLSQKQMPPCVPDSVLSAHSRKNWKIKDSRILFGSGLVEEIRFYSYADKNKQSELKAKDTE